MPSYTHSENARDGMQPFVTVREAFREIPRTAPGNVIHASMRGKTFPWWDDTTIFRYTVCTQGIRDERTKMVLGHPSGKRYLTTCELAAIQGIPWQHTFPSSSMTTVRRLIGNAYPSSMAQVIFKIIRKSLEKTDAESADEVEE